MIDRPDAAKRGLFAAPHAHRIGGLFTDSPEPLVAQRAKSTIGDNREFVVTPASEPDQRRIDENINPSFLIALAFGLERKTDAL